MNSFLEKLLNYYHLSPQDYNEITRDFNLVDLENPNNFLNIQEAVTLIKKSLSNDEKIMVYGDYDVDGICSTSIMVNTLTLLGGQRGYYLPSRYVDGYGINLSRAQQIADKGYNLVILVDNGVHQHEAVSFLLDKGIKVLIIDHHDFEKNPDQRAILVHPYLKKEKNVLNCASYVAFMVSRLLLDGINEKNLILAMTATISDMMELKSYNRILVRLGIKILNSNKNNSLWKLTNQSYIDEKVLGFDIIPKLNAYGRMMEKPVISRLVEFVLNDDSTLVEEIIAVNEKRKNLLRKEIKLLPDFTDVHLIVYYKKDLKEGLVGLLAGQLANLYHKVSIVLTDSSENGVIKGSIRTANDFNILLLLDEEKPYLLTGGGHHSAGGLSLKKEDLSKFVETGNLFMGNQIIEEKAEEYIDVSENEITLENLQIIETLKPFGQGFPEPLLGIKVKTSTLYAIGKENQHLKVSSPTFSAIGFNLKKPENCDTCLLLGNLEKNEFNSRVTPQLRILKIKP